MQRAGLVGGREVEDEAVRRGQGSLKGHAGKQQLMCRALSHAEGVLT